MPGPLLEVRDVRCRYGDRIVLDDISLQVRPGDHLGIVGPSGAGKSTLLGMLLGTIAPVAGTIDRAPGLRTGYVPQVERVNWKFPVTVGEVVLMARPQRRLRPRPSRDDRADVERVLHRLGLVDLTDRHIGALSGGQQQRVFIARALLGSPDLLVMDEPTAGVDVRTRHDLMHLLADLNAEGLAMILSTHDLNGVATHLPRIVCLNRTIRGAGAPAEVLTPETLEATYGAPMDVLEHAGMPIVVDRPHRHQGHVVGHAGREAR